jgi:hypothetical protein
MTTMLRISAGVSAIAMACGLAACGGSHEMLPGQSGSVNARAPISALTGDAETSALTPDKKTKIKISPATLALTGTGVAAAGSFTISETNYKGKFKAKSTCSAIATIAPASPKGPKSTVKATPKKAGSCTVTFTDTAKNTAKITITDTTATMTLGALSFSPGSTSVKVLLTSVNGKPASGTATTPVASTCLTAGCSVAVPRSAAGNDAYAVAIYDAANGTGNLLATGNVPATTVKAGVANVIVAPQLAKVPGSLSFQGITPANAGTTFTHTLSLTVKDADGAAIVGTYSTPVTVSDADTSAIALGTSIALNRGSASRSVSLTQSSDTMTFTYGGLAIAPVTVTASANGATNGAVTFTATLQPLASSVAEIDLYNANSGQPGYSGSLSLTQSGWIGNPYGNFASYALGGSSNNCGSYAVSPASGTAATYTVSVGATPVAGTCTLTLTGAPGTATQAIVLTYTSSSIGVSSKHRKP